MNRKFASWAFCGMVLLHMGVGLVLGMMGEDFAPGIIGTLLLSELVLVIPAAVSLFFYKGKRTEALALRKVKISTLWMVLLYTFLMMPLTTLLNAVSMLFVDNVMGSLSGEVLRLPFWLTFLMIAVWGPVCEEFCFRGVIFGGYRSSGNTRGAVILSAILFGLIHMNFNQAPYAFALGVAMALLLEATGSLLAPILMHLIFNGQSVIQMYLYESFAPGVLQAELDRGYTSDEIILVISVYLVIALISTALAACVLVWIASNENRRDNLLDLRDPDRRGPRILDIPVILAIIVCTGLMIYALF